MNSALKKLRRPFRKYFGVTFKRERWSETNFSEIDLDEKVIHYSMCFDDDEAFVAISFHEIGHLLATRSKTSRTYEEYCWKIGFALMEGMFNIKKTPAMDALAKRCLRTYSRAGYAEKLVREYEQKQH